MYLPVYAVHARAHLTSYLRDDDARDARDARDACNVCGDGLCSVRNSWIHDACLNMYEFLP